MRRFRGVLLDVWRQACRHAEIVEAGVESSLSVLKRAHKLNRRLFKGYKHFASSVGCAVFCYRHLPALREAIRKDLKTKSAKEGSELAT
ncbi:MAG: hypothetical protein HQ559_18270 [Lentisphaerae bacterium]|nr:hypothetical protein [Lentisphaerota bacterium]